MKTEKISFKNSKGQKLAGKLWTPAKWKHTVVFINGVGGVKEAWEPWPEELAKLGYRTFTFDFRGRGESEGAFEEANLTTNIDDLKSAIDFLASAVTLIGGSFGGTTSICIAAKDKRVNRLITLATSHNMDVWVGGKMLAKAQRKGYVIYPEGKISLEFFKDARRHKVLEKAKKVSVPWLIVHGDKDTDIPLQHAKDLYKAAKCAKKLAIIKGADHNFSSKKADAQVFSLLADWLKRYLK